MALTQAAAVFKKFGGVPALFKALQSIGCERVTDISAVYRWDLPKAGGGTGGMIPSSTLPFVLRAARHDGIVITKDDLYPTPAAKEQNRGR